MAPILKMKKHAINFYRYKFDAKKKKKKKMKRKKRKKWEYKHNANKLKSFPKVSILLVTDEL